jgi:hypothetical protein
MLQVQVHHRRGQSYLILLQRLLGRVRLGQLQRLLQGLLQRLLPCARLGQLQGNLQRLLILQRLQDHQRLLPRARLGQLQGNLQRLLILQRLQDHLEPLGWPKPKHLHKLHKLPQVFKCYLMMTMMMTIMAYANTIRIHGAVR